MREQIHGGDIYRSDQVIDFSVNGNPLGPPEAVLDAVRESANRLVHYPDVRCRELREAISRFEGVPASRILCGNGAAELFFAVVMAVMPKRALVTAPAFAEYERALRAVRSEIRYYELKEENEFDVQEDIVEQITEDLDMIFLCSPNNPTGRPIGRKLMEQILSGCREKDVCVVLDECFIEFLEDPDCFEMKDRLGQDPNLFIVKAFTKIFGMPGLRLGYGMSGNPELLSRMGEFLQPWNVSVPAQAGGVAALSGCTDYMRRTREYVAKEREYLKRELENLGYTVYNSVANYVFFRGETGLYEEALKAGFLIRDCQNYRGLGPGYYRIAVRTGEDDARLLEWLGKRQKKGRRAKRIMIQGTMSNAGKSLICAGLCRIFRQDGYKVTPFKSQNMALNSFITEDGLEMGRAQVVQAEAAGIAPKVQMNPILLKPVNNTGSQVIVNGEVLENMSARDYFAYKKKLIPDIRKAFHELEEEYDIIVIEGAGSPAEINLKQDDIVNMGLAKMVDAPVLLVGDIDRGGVFAQLLGTLMLLEEEEKERVKGLIINKFRGDKTILDPGIDMLVEKGGIPVVGVTPYIQVDIEDEDSLAGRLTDSAERGLLDIAVIRLPRISNFSDFLSLENVEGAALRYVDRRAHLGHPDMIILPGTKNTMEDLKWLRQSGLEAEILKAAAAGSALWGICGGYQMLGNTLSDPEGVESGGSMKGMGLLPVDTVFTEQKTRTRVTGTFRNIEGIFAGLKDVQFEGYEIHMGESSHDVPSMSELRDSVRDKMSGDGVCRGNVYGTYVHGIFDREEVVRGIVEALAGKKGIPATQLRSVNLREFKERQYDLLADALREHLDMEKIYEIMEG